MLSLEATEKRDICNFMDLYTWLAKKRIQKKDFAKKLGITRTHIYRIFQGKMSYELAKKIVEITNGEVKICELLSKKEK